MAGYIPEKVDLVFLTFTPQSGHEERGRRPALVVSNHTFNRHTGLAIVCPVTTTNRRYPFHVSVPQDLSLSGFIMVEQVKSVDYRSHDIQFVEKAPQDVMVDILEILDACIYQ